VKKYLFILTLCASHLLAQVPAWYTSQSHPKYKKDYYLIGVGSGTTGLDAAKKAALADLAAQLRVQVQSEMKSVTESYTMNNDEQLYSDVRNRSRTVVSDELVGAEIAETSVDPSSGTAFALAILNKRNYSESIASELESGWKEASTLRAGAVEYFKKGRLTEAVQSLLQIRQVIAPLFAKQVLHNAVASVAFNSPSMFHPNTIYSDIRGFLSNVKIEKKSGDNQKGKIGEQFSQPLAVMVSVNADGGSVPCSGVPVEFVYDGKINLGKGMTDNNGTVTVSTAIRPMVNDGIQARLALPDIGKDFEKNIAASAAVFIWTAEKSDKMFTLQVNAKMKKVADAIQSKLSQAISKAGYTVVPGSNYIITVDVQSGTPGNVQGMAGTLYSVELETIARFMDSKTNQTRGAAKFTSRGVGKTEAEAMEKAASNLKVNEKELGELLEK